VRDRSGITKVINAAQLHEREREGGREEGGGRGGVVGVDRYTGFLLRDWRALLRVYTALLSVTHESVAEGLVVVRSP